MIGKVNDRARPVELIEEDLDEVRGGAIMKTIHDTAKAAQDVRRPLGLQYEANVEAN